MNDQEIVINVTANVDKFVAGIDDAIVAVNKLRDALKESKEIWDSMQPLEEQKEENEAQLKAVKELLQMAKDL